MEYSSMNTKDPDKYYSYYTKYTADDFWVHSRCFCDIPFGQLYAVEYYFYGMRDLVQQGICWVVIFFFGTRESCHFWVAISPLFDEILAMLAYS